MPKDLDDAINRCIVALSAAACTDWGDWAHGLLSGEQKRIFEEGLTAACSNENTAEPLSSIVGEEANPSRLVSVCTPSPASTRQSLPKEPEPEALPPIKLQASTELSAPEGSSITYMWPLPPVHQSLVPETFPQSCSQAWWETEMVDQTKVAAWHKAQKGRGGKQVCRISSSIFATDFLLVRLVSQTQEVLCCSSRLQEQQVLCLCQGQEIVLARAELDYGLQATRTASHPTSCAVNATLPEYCNAETVCTCHRDSNGTSALLPTT